MLNPVDHPKGSHISDFTGDIMGRIYEIRDKARKHLQQVADKNIEYYRERQKDRLFNQGDYAYTLNVKNLTNLLNYTANG